jgi:hypothetical protein
MKTLFTFMLFLALTAVANAASIPYSPELEEVLIAQGKEKTIVAVYDVSKTGYGSSTTDSGVHGLQVYLPAKTIIKQGYAQIVTAFTDSGAGTVALSCEDANNILTAEDLTNDAVGMKALNATGVAGAMVGPSTIANTCEVKATVSGADQSTGKMLIFLETAQGI